MAVKLDEMGLGRVLFLFIGAMRHEFNRGKIESRESPSRDQLGMALRPELLLIVVH